MKTYPDAFWNTETGKRMMYQRGYRWGKNNPNRPPAVDNPDYLKGFYVGRRFHKNDKRKSA